MGLPARVRGALLSALIVFLAGCAADAPRHAVSAPPAALASAPEPEPEPAFPPAGFVGPRAPVPAPESAPAPARRPASIHDPEPYENINQRFDFSVGGALLRNFDTTLQVLGPDGGGGAILDLENLLNVDDDSTILRIDSTYSFSRKHGIVFTFYDLNRNGTVGINEDIDVGTVTIPESSVSTNFDTTIVKLAYRFDFVRDTRTNIGASFGFHYMGIDFGISSSLGTDFEEQFRANLPLPVLGLHFQYALGHKWELYSSVEFLQVDVEALRGYISDTRVGINHSPFKHFGWGLGYNGFDLQASFDTSSDLEVDIEYGFQGFMLYLRTFF